MLSLLIPWISCGTNSRERTISDAMKPTWRHSNGLPHFLFRVAEAVSHEVSGLIFCDRVRRTGGFVGLKWQHLGLRRQGILKKKHYDLRVKILDYHHHFTVVITADKISISDRWQSSTWFFMAWWKKWFHSMAKYLNIVRTKSLSLLSFIILKW